MPNSLMPAQDSMIQGGRLSTLSAGRAAIAPVQRLPKPTTLPQPVRAVGGFHIPQFLRSKG